MNTVTIKNGSNANFTDKEWASFDTVYMESVDDFFSFLSSGMLDKLGSDAELVFEQ